MPAVPAAAAEWPEGGVLACAEYVASQSVHVKVNSDMSEAARRVASGMTGEAYSTATWRTHALHPKVADERALDWIFVVDLLNFSFWPDDGQPQLEVEYRGNKYSGYWALCAGVNRAVDEGIPFTTPSCWESLTRDQLAHIFRGTVPGTTAPLIDERLDLLRTAAAVLRQKYRGSFAGCVAAAARSAQRLLRLLLCDFGRCFEDASEYRGRRVLLLKRAQILVADVWACFEGASFGAFDDIDSITMFADNRVPQSLLFVGAISYSPELMGILQRGEHLPAGGEMEVEIRACSIWAVELLLRELRRVLGDAHPSPPNAILVDMYLWDYAKAHSAELTAFPTHKTRTIHY